MLRKLAFGMVALALSACESDYARFYTPMPAEALAQTQNFPGQPAVISSTGDAGRDVDAMFTRGFGPVGISDFNGPVRNVNGALEQAKKVGAQYIVVSRQYARTVQGAVPITTLVPETTYSSGTVNAYGSGGYASGTYSGTSTSYNSQTSYIPFSVDRYDQKALFFSPLARQGIGIRVVEIGPEDAQRLGTLKGVIIKSVRRSSPAFDADVLPGDVLIAVAGKTVVDRQTAMADMHAAYGSDLSITLLRSGNKLTKTLHLPLGGVWN